MLKNVILFFSNVVKELKIKNKENLLCDVSNINDPIERAIQKYNHPSIQMIKETFDNNKRFSFDLVSLDTIFKEIVSPDTNKSTHSNDVPTKIVKANADPMLLINLSFLAYFFLS